MDFDILCYLVFRWPVMATNNIVLVQFLWVFEYGNQTVIIFWDSFFNKIIWVTIFNYFYLLMVKSTRYFAMNLQIGSSATYLVVTNELASTLCASSSTPVLSVRRSVLLTVVKFLRTFNIFFWSKYETVKENTKIIL